MKSVTVASQKSMPDVLADTTLSAVDEKKSNVTSKITLNKSRSSSKSTSESSTDANIYTSSLLNKKVILSISQIGGDIKEVLQKSIMDMIEGKCIVEGYVKPNSVRVISYSSGVVEKENIVFEVKFECLVCFPVEGMEITCIVKDVTKAGIRAVTEVDPSPFIVFVARDHHNMKKEFSSVAPGELITVKVIGQRYELNDPHIFIIAELGTGTVNEVKSKKKLVISES